MTQKRILQLAYYKAVDVWSSEKEDTELWASDYNRAKEKRAWDELQEITRLLYEEEHKGEA